LPPSRRAQVAELKVLVRTVTDGTGLVNKRKGKNVVEAAKHALYEDSKYPVLDQAVEVQLDLSDVGDMDGVSDLYTLPTQVVVKINDVESIKGVVDERNEEIKVLKDKLAIIEEKVGKLGERGTMQGGKGGEKVVSRQVIKLTAPRYTANTPVY